MGGHKMRSAKTPFDLRVASPFVRGAFRRSRLDTLSELFRSFWSSLRTSGDSNGRFVFLYPPKDLGAIHA
jgi:hypothetical protein